MIELLYIWTCDKCGKKVEEDWGVLSHGVDLTPQIPGSWVTLSWSDKNSARLGHHRIEMQHFCGDCHDLRTKEIIQ